MAEADLLEHFNDTSDDRTIRTCNFLLVESHVRQMMSATWYVTVELHKSGVLPRPRHPRHTTTFESEAQAKDFARAKLREGLIVFAGTINPFTPRRTVLSHDVAAWVADEQ